MMHDSAKRAGNARGFGGQLRDEILAAAERLLAESGSREAVTLRAIAREAGIAAPSIYPHFKDRDAIIDEVVAHTFASIARACDAAARTSEPGIDEVEAIAMAYLGFARVHPGQYRILFERSPANISSPPHPYPEGIAAFDLLVQALGRVPHTPSNEVDLQLSAQSLFAMLHGMATLRPALPGFPWRDAGEVVRHIVAAEVR